MAMELPLSARIRSRVGWVGLSGWDSTGGSLHEFDSKNVAER
jgi:hypothetical protein